MAKGRSLLPPGPGYDGFVRGAPLLDTYTYRIVKDNTVQTQLFKTGEVDFALPDPSDWDEISKLPHAQPAPFYHAVGSSWDYIGFNLRNPLLADKVVRQAISTAINQERAHRKGPPGTRQGAVFDASVLLMGPADDERTWSNLIFVPGQAKKMLDDAGYKAGADGIRAKDGKQLKFNIR